MKKDIFKNQFSYVISVRIALKLVFVLSFVFLSSAQNITETRWYFGNATSNLVFDQNGRDVYLQNDQATPFGNAGAVTITDQFTGNLLFYTDGETVYDVSHNITPSGTGLSGNSSINVPVVACPVTGSPGQYYLITNSGNTGVNEIQYTVVDANQVGNGSPRFPYGDVTTTNVGTGLTNPSEGMLIIPSGNGELFWLITQDRISFEVRVTQIDAGGVGATTNFNFTDGSTPGFESARFAFNADSAQLVMAPITANRNLWLMDFDQATGALAFDRTLTGTGFDDGAGASIYGVEWSPDGSKVYFSRFGGTGTIGQVYQIDFNDPTETVNPILPAPVFRSYGLKRAIDNRIYHLYQETDAGSPYSLGRINRPDSTADLVDYQTIVFPDDFNAQQFPEFTPGYDFVFDTFNFYWIDSCETNVTKFFPIIDPVPNNLTWDFGDGENSNNWIPNYTYMAAGGYTVSMTAEVGGISQTISQPVEILTNDLMINLGNDTTICIDEVLTLDAGTGTSYVWSTGETTQTINVDTTGTYWVEVTTANGCTDFDDIEVLEYGVTEQIYNQWYFGEQAGIDFNNGPIAILDANNQDAEEGCATISDINGDLLFYTNGVTVWNRDHEVMVNGNNIGGDQRSAQNTLIMPFAGDETLFYLFTTEQVYGDDAYALRYSVIDMKGDTAKGKVVIKDIKLMENSTERITGSGFTGNDIIVAHEFGNNIFRSFLTNDTGLSGAVFSPSGAVHDFMTELSATGYMKISPNFNVIAVNIPGTGEIEILDLDQGQVSNPRLIDTGETGLYGLEFSTTGNRLYATTSSELIQYDLDSLNSANPASDIEATKFDGYVQGSGYGALQMGPNGQIYMAVDNSETIGIITAPDGDDAANGFDPMGFDLLGRTSRLGLPNFAQVENSPSQEPSISVTDGCIGQVSTFAATGRDPNNSIENYLWIFGDGTSAVVQDTTHTYSSPGTYTVQMILSNRCDTDTTLSTTITIHNVPENPTVPSDTALCDQPIVLEAWPVDNPEFSYFWSTGETSRQITVANPNIIDVAIIDNTTGCSSDTLSVFLADARPQVALGTDRMICQNDPVITLDARVVNATSYTWLIDGVASGSNRTLDVDTSTPGSFEYMVSAVNSFGCTNSDNILIIIQEEPNITSVGNQTTGCGNNDGFIEITFNSSGSYSYELTGPSNAGPFNFDGLGSQTIPAGSVTPGDGNLPPGNYNLNVTNLVTGCVKTEVVQVEDPGNLGLAASALNACIGDGEINLNFNLLTPSNFDLIIDYQDGSNITGTSLNSTYTNPVNQNLDTGTYFITVRDTDPLGLGCVETDRVRIQLLNPQPNFTFDAIQEICEISGDILITDNTSGSATYSWTGPSTVGTTGTSITVTQAGTYTVTADGASFCPREEDIEVIFNSEPVVDVNISGDPCEGEIILIADVSGGSSAYIYDWNDGSQAARNTVTSSETYNVMVTDQLTGCEITSNDVNVNVEDEFTVNLALDSDCENNGQVFLIATTNYFDASIAYKWQDGGGNVLADSDSIFTVTDSGTYTVIATNETGTCMVSESIDAAVVPINPEDLILPERATFCTIDPNDPTVTLDPGIFNTYEWRLTPDQTIISTDQTLQVSSEGTYEVTLYNGFTCLADEVKVVEDCRPKIIAPNAFSPNGNAENETFSVFPNDAVAQFEIFIYTRWGELVYRSENIDFQWDGVYRGRLLPPGTYAYIMKFSSSLEPGLGTVEQYGAVTLIR
ncbi:MAG: gliding motility-associated C-terminal domain-containing protein [Ekhidna sp.]|nr:gliding motility-associated C-terminal domain-containing protein [Ekhidna sp.]